MLVRSRMRWLGHVSRMDNDRTVKCHLYGELNKGVRPVGRPKLRYKDTCKSILKTGDARNNWHHFVTDRPLWKQITRQTCEAFNQKRVAQYERRKVNRRRKVASR